MGKAEDFIKALPADRQEAFSKLRQVLRKNLPAGFEESVVANMIHYVVPLKIYPKGYHATPGQALPFISIASQKNFIAMYHMGLYGSPGLLKWWTTEYPKHSKSKLDMGKSCVRFKKPEQIPFDLVGELAAKVSVEDWISAYEKALKR